MPPLNPWIYLGVLLAFVGVGLGGFFYGNHVGHAEEKAALVDTIDQQFKKYAADVNSAAEAGTAAALADFKAKASVLDDLATSLRSAQGVMNNAASRLSASLRGGSCKLDPAQRRLLECIRRPSDPACTAPAAPPL